MNATLAIIASFGLIACGMYFAVSGKGATTRVKVFSVEVDGGLGAIMVMIGVVGLGLTAWWDWNETQNDPVPAETDDINGINEPEDPTDDGPFIGDAYYTTLNPWTYGDDYDLDTLSDLCWGGDMYSCDRLFYDSLADSDYEYIGATCGGEWEFDYGTCAARSGLGE